MSKGHQRRPQTINNDDFNERWDTIFNEKEKTEEDKSSSQSNEPVQQTEDTQGSEKGIQEFIKDLAKGR